jgi:ParB family chromosome partitioning protein
MDLKDSQLPMKKENKDKNVIDNFCIVPISKIHYEINIRKKYKDESLNELADSIKQFGLLQPIRVYYENGKYNIIFGHRRYLACKKAGFNEITVIISSKPDNIDTIYLQLVENGQIEIVSPEDLEKYIKLLKDKYKQSIEQISEKIGKSKSYIYKLYEANKVREKHGEIFSKTGIKLTTYDTQLIKNASDEDIAKTINNIAQNPSKKTKYLSELYNETNKKEMLAKNENKPNTAKLSDGNNEDVIELSNDSSDSLSVSTENERDNPAEIKEQQDDSLSIVETKEQQEDSLSTAETKEQQDDSLSTSEDKDNKNMKFIIGFIENIDKMKVTIFYEIFNESQKSEKMISFLFDTLNEYYKNTRYTVTKTHKPMT